MNKRLLPLALFLLIPLGLLLPVESSATGEGGDCVTTTSTTLETTSTTPDATTTTPDTTTTVPCPSTTTTQAQTTTTVVAASTIPPPPTTVPQVTTSVPIIVLPGTGTTGSGSVPNLGFTGPGLPATGSSNAVLACESSVGLVKVAYQPRKVMVADRQEVVEVRVSLPSADAAVSLPGDGQVVIVDAELGCIVRARLFGGSGFQVDPKEAVTKSFVKSDSIQFSWVVTPLKTGDSALNLQIESVIREGGYEYASQPRSFSAEISVKAKPRSVGGKVTDASQAFIDFPLVKGAKVVAGFAALVAAVWGWLHKRAKAKSLRNTEEEGA